MTKTGRLRTAAFLAIAAVTLLLAGVLPAAQATPGIVQGISGYCHDTAYACTPGGYTATASTTGNGWAWTYYGEQGAGGIGTPTGPHNCTLYVAWRLQSTGLANPGRSWGNAAQWATSIGGGDHRPAVGAVASWGTEVASGFGHVAYVEQVSPDGSNVFVRADNYWSAGGYTDAGWISASSVDLFLHPHDAVVSLPAQPGTPRVVSTTGTSAVLAWADASNNEDSFVSQYRIGSGSWVAGPSVGANATSATVGGLAAGTAYTFQVGARNSRGTHWSAYFYGTTVSLPAQPTNPGVRSTTGSTAVVAWTDASSNETSFASQYRVGSGSWVAGPSVGANSTTMTVTGLTPATAYTFQVGARNSAGTKWSAYFTGSTPQVLPAQPATPHVTSSTGSSAGLAWTDASNNETDFVTQYRIGSGGWVAGPTVGANATSVTVGGLAAGTAYTFQVGARNSAGTHWSAYFYGTTVSLPAQPAGAHVVSTSSSSAVLAWTDASNNETDFVTQYRIGSGGWVAGPTVGANATSVTVGGLAAGTAYTFQVGARNSAGTHWSGYANGTTINTSATLPAQPTNPQVSSTSSSSAVLAWTDASNNETDFVTQYRIGSGGWVAGPTVGANSTSVTVGGLAAGTAYTFQVGARNSAGTHWSAYAYGTTSSAPALNYQVTNYDSDGTTGVYLRNSSDINDVTRDSAHFVSYGTTVTLLCGAFGSSVGPYGNTAWDYVRVADGRTGWVSEHWLNTPVGNDQHVAGEPACTTAPATLPAQPTNPQVSSPSSSSAVLAWTDASNNETDFVTQYRIGSGGWVAGPTVGANSTSVTVGGLAAGTAYTFQVGARNSAGTHWSAYAYGTTSSASALNYQVTNYDSDGTTGVYLRNSSDINDVTRDSAHFVSYGTTVTLLCGAFGSSVGPYGNTAWDYVRVADGRTGWVSEHWLNTPVGNNQHVAGEPGC